MYLSVFYYNVINGYKEPFIYLRVPSEKYFPNAKFDELFSVFTFDRNIKMIYLKYILKAEHHLKTVIAHEFSKSYGYDNYLKTENFDTSTNDKLKEVLQTIEKLNTVLSNQLNKSKEITHYLTTHGYVPLWVICNNGWYCYNISKKITLVINQGQIHLQIKLLHDLAAQQMSTLNKLKLNNFP